MWKNDAFSKRDLEHVKHVIRVGQCEILNLKPYCSEAS